MNHEATAMPIPWASRWKAARTRIVRRIGTAATAGPINAKKAIVFAQDTFFDQGLEQPVYKGAPCRFFFAVTYFASNSGFNFSAYTA